MVFFYLYVAVAANPVINKPFSHLMPGRSKDECIFASAIVDSPGCKRLDMHPCGDFGQLHMHDKGLAGKWRERRTSGLSRQGLQERA